MRSMTKKFYLTIKRGEVPQINVHELTLRFMELKAMIHV